MWRRSCAVAALSCAALMLVAACGRSADGSSKSASSALIGVDYPRSDTDFWNSYISYVPKYAKSEGADIKTTNSQNDIQTLISNVQALVSQGAKAVVMAPQDTAAVGPEIAQLNSRKIPVISVDTRPDTGNVYMVVRADNVQLGQKACAYLGQQMKGKGSVAVLEGDTASINGRDRTSGFDDCMKAKYPAITVYGLPAKWDADAASSMLQTALTQHPDITGVYMESSFALSGTEQVLQQKGLLLPRTNPKHVWTVSNDGIPQEYADIRAGKLDATVSQPADQYAKYAIFYAKAALAGKTFSAGKTDHDSNIVQVRPGVLEDQLSSTLVTTANVDDKSLWGNNLTS